MADETEKGSQEPNLELPSLLGFGRKKKRKGSVVPDEPATQELATAGSAAEPAPIVVDSPEEGAPQPGVPATGDPQTGDPVVQPRGSLAPSTGKPKRLPPVPPPPGRGESVETRAPRVPPPPAPQAGPLTHLDSLEAQEVQEARTAPEPVTAHEPVAYPTPPTALEETTALPPEREMGPLDPTGATLGTEMTAVTTATTATTEPGEEPAREAPGRRRPTFTVPAINPRLAAVVSGAVVGLTAMVLAYLTGRGCEAVRGVGSCGGIGLFALVVIVAIEVVLGGALLKAWQISDPTSTSFLGVGLAASFVLLFLFSSLDSGWMFIVLPVLTGLTFLLSMWVTDTFVDGMGNDALGR